MASRTAGRLNPAGDVAEVDGLAASVLPEEEAEPEAVVLAAGEPVCCSADEVVAPEELSDDDDAEAAEEGSEVEADPEVALAELLADVDEPEPAPALEPEPDASFPFPQGMAGVDGFGWLACLGGVVFPFWSAMAKRVVHWGLEDPSVVAW